MKKVFLLIFVLSSVVVLAQNKSEFDISENHLLKAGLNKIQNDFREYKLISEYLEATMVTGGYFTIGTNKGISGNKLDDNCSITFGHPYAMTSHPIFSIDGVWLSYSDLLFDNSIIHKKTDTLTYTVSNNKLEIIFSIIINNDKQSIKLLQTIINKDTLSHIIEGGLIFDPSLGKFGDGYINLPEGFLQTEKVFSSTDIPEQLFLWERTTGAKGVGIEILFNNKPEKIICTNWNNLYNNFEPDLEIIQDGKLYDLDIAMYWKGENLQPLDSITNEVDLKLVQPDFSSQVFTRWDLPSFISMEDNEMFPRNFDTYLELENTTNTSISDIVININQPSSLQSAYSKIDVPAINENPLFQKIPLRSKIVYEDKIVDIGITITKGNTVLDELHRNVYIPATPVSDTGLVIVNDSISTENFPGINLVFSVEVESSGQRILNLQEDNIFLYENSIRVNDFNIEKYSEDGVDLVDVVFVLDCSGSMGNEINQVKENIGEFADSLSARGFDYKIGIVTFSTTVDDVWDLTNDIEEIKNNLASIGLWGGIEDSPAALYQATELSLRPGSKRTIIWITDEAYPEHTYTKEQIVNRMLSLDFTVHGVGLNELQTEWFNPIVLPTGGKFYDINGNFRDILLDVSRMEAQDRYKLSYISQLTSAETIELTLEVHIAGLGVIKTYVVSPDTSPELNSNLSFFPNPFNPQINFVVNRTNYIKGDLVIYNLLGERVKKFSLNENGVNNISWNAKNEFGSAIGSGFYIVQLLLTDKSQKVSSETAKILYLK